MKSKEEAIEEVRKNRLNDLCMQGIGFIDGTAEVIDLGIAKFLTDYGDNRDMFLKVYAVLDKETKKRRTVGYYLAWIYTENEKNNNTFASFGWIREFLSEIEELSEAIKKLNFKTYQEYRDI